jgi:hypothetical protein
MNAFLVDGKLLCAAVSRCALGPSRALLAALASTGFLRLGLSFLLLTFLCLRILIPFAGPLRGGCALWQILFLSAVLRLFSGRLPWGLATRWTRAIRRILVQALPGFLEIGQQLRRQSSQRLHGQPAQVNIIKLLEIVIAQLHVGSDTPFRGSLDLEQIFSYQIRFVSYPTEIPSDDCWGAERLR